MSEIRIDAFLPSEMATRAEYLGVRKAEMPFVTMFLLAMMAGAFIGLGAIFATTISAGSMAVSAPDGTVAFNAGLPYGISRLLTGIVFCLGLILVVVGGAELFTGNNLIVMAWASGKITGRMVLRNWGIVYLGNFVGSIAIAFLTLMSKQYTFGSNSVGVAALKIAVGKVNLEFWQALALGVLCNALVCMAIWLTYSARSTMDKIIAIIFPITAFVAAGFEHSVANMYFVPYALLIKIFNPDFVTSVADKVPGIENLTWSAFFLNNLIPVTIGNIIGGTLLVASIYWTVFLRNKDK